MKSQKGGMLRYDTATSRWVGQPNEQQEMPSGQQDAQLFNFLEVPRKPDELSDTEYYNAVWDPYNVYSMTRMENWNADNEAEILKLLLQISRARSTNLANSFAARHDRAHLDQLIATNTLIQILRGTYVDPDEVRRITQNQITMLRNMVIEIELRCQEEAEAEADSPCHDRPHGRSSATPWKEGISRKHELKELSQEDINEVFALLDPPGVPVLHIGGGTKRKPKRHKSKRRKTKRRKSKRRKTRRRKNN